LLGAGKVVVAPPTVIGKPAALAVPVESNTNRYAVWPDANVTDGPPAAPVAEGAWSKVGDRWVYTYKDPRIASIMMYPNGECEFDTASVCNRDHDSIDVSTCNPPPPQPVQCPAGAPDSDDDQGH